MEPAASPDRYGGLTPSRACRPSPAHSRARSTVPTQRGIWVASTSGKDGHIEWSREEGNRGQYCHTHGQTHLIKASSTSPSRPPLPSMTLIAGWTQTCTQHCRALSFLLRAGLLRVDSYVYYDTTSPWFREFRRSMVEAKRAHLQALQRGLGMVAVELQGMARALATRPRRVRCARCGTVKGGEVGAAAAMRRGRLHDGRNPLWFQQMVVAHNGITARQVASDRAKMATEPWGCDGGFGQLGRRGPRVPQAL